MAMVRNLGPLLQAARLPRRKNPRRECGINGLAAVRFQSVGQNQMKKFQEAVVIGRLLTTISKT
jgi:hypothetical protein